MATKIITTGETAIYNAFRNNKVKHIFTYSGSITTPLIELFRNKSDDIKYYSSIQEQNCGYSAIGYAKSTGKTGVAMITSGVGLANMLAPLLDAKQESTPFIVFSGHTLNYNKSIFQNYSFSELTKEYTKWSYCARQNDDLYELTNEAFKVANNGKKGSVHIDLPLHIFREKNGTRTKFIENPLSQYNNDYSNHSKSNCKDESYYSHLYLYLSKLINESKQPLIWAGKGVNDYAELLQAFVKNYDIHITSTIQALGAFSDNNILSLGFVETPESNYATQNADLIIALGCRFDDKIANNMSKYAPNCKHIIHVNIDSSEMNRITNTEFGKRIVYKMNLDCEIFLSNMNRVFKTAEYMVDRLEWKTKIHNHKLNFRIQTDTISNQLTTESVIKQINKSISRIRYNTLITSSAGIHQNITAQHIKWMKPNHFITSGNLKLIGAGLPYAVGVSIGNLNKTVILIDSNKSFNYTMTDLQTVVKYNLPIKIFILDENHTYLNTRLQELPVIPNYNLIAKSYGIQSIELNNESELQQAIEYVLDYEGPILCNIKIQKEMISTVVSTRHSSNEIILFNDTPIFLL